MSVFFDVPIYGVTMSGQKIPIGTAKQAIDGVYHTGGKIFYIDDTATGATYTFYDSDGEVITDVRVGDAPTAYKVTGTPNKDKYYIFNNALQTSKRWTYYENGEYVYNSLGTQTGIGTGKSNTALVMAADDGKYVTNDSNGSPTAWYQIQLMRTNQTGDNTDWFLPSRGELDALRTATDRDGNALVTWFANNYIWSSSEYSAQNAWLWHCNSGGYWYNYGKNDTNGVVGVRAF